MAMRLRSTLKVMRETLAYTNRLVNPKRGTQIERELRHIH